MLTHTEFVAVLVGTRLLYEVSDGMLKCHVLTQGGGITAVVVAVAAGVVVVMMMMVYKVFFLSMND